MYVSHCGQRLSSYVGPQKLPGEPDLHLWNCGVCRSSVTGPNPVDMLEALEFSVRLLGGCQPYSTIKHMGYTLTPGKHLPFEQVFKAVFDTIHVRPLDDAPRDLFSGVAGQDGVSRA